MEPNDSTASLMRRTFLEERRHFLQNKTIKVGKVLAKLCRFRQPRRHRRTAGLMQQLSGGESHQNQVPSRLQSDSSAPMHGDPQRRRKVHPDSNHKIDAACGRNKLRKILLKTGQRNAPTLREIVGKTQALRTEILHRDLEAPLSEIDGIAPSALRKAKRSSWVELTHP